jgi:hypothetical protein
VGAVLNNAQRDEMLLLPFAYNYPIFFEKFYGSEKTFDSIDGIISIKHEFSFNKLPEDWDQKLIGPERVVSWLKEKFSE